MARPPRTPATAGARRGECIVPLRQCSDAAPTRTETSTGSSRRRDRIDLRLHHYRPTRYDSHCVAGWMEGKYLGTQTSFAGRICGAADPGCVVYDLR